MKRHYILPAILLAAPAAFAGPSCEGMEASFPMWEIAKGFEEGGGKIILMKVTNDGCYEIYGKEGDKKLEIYYNPADGTELEREES